MFRKSWDDVWFDVETALESADSIAFDGCHKIYVLMDTREIVEHQVTQV